MIYVVKHSEEEITVPLLNNYKELKVGKLFEDNGRDNINHLNPYINEATGLYDLWKNCNDEYIGMTHYRRLFLDERNFVLRYNKAIELLNEYKVDMLCTPFHPFDDNYTILSYFRYSLSVSNNPDSVKILDKYYDKLVEKIGPKFNWYFKNRQGFIARNMFFCRKEIIDEYCKWLFPIIIPLTEEFIKNDVKACVTQERLLGHFIERIFSYWIECSEKVSKFLKLDYITIDNND